MNTTALGIIIILAILGAAAILFRRPSTSSDSGYQEPNGGGSADPVALSKQSPSGSMGSLLNQLSMINAREFPSLSLHQLPQKLKSFVGRKEIIQEIMGRSWDGPGMICLYGGEGMGKTTLACQMGHDIAKRYPDGQIVLNLRGDSSKPLSIARAMGFVIRTFYPSEKLPQDTNILVDEYTRVLKGKRVLLILDNVANLGQIKRLIPPKSCFMIITSRSRIVLPKMYTREITELYPQDTEALLMYYSLRTRSWSEEILKHCGHSPLAVNLAGGYLRANEIVPLEKISSDLADERRNLKFSGEEGGNKENQPINVDVETIFNIIIRSLRKETASVLRRMILFTGTFDAKAEEAVCGDSNNDHLKLLCQLKLVEYDELNQRYYLHELIQDLIRPTVRPSERILSGRSHAFHYYSVLSSARDLCDGDSEEMTSALNIVDLEWENIKAGQDWSADKVSEDGEIAKLCANFTKAGEGLIPYRNNPKDCIKWHESALTASRQLQNIEGQKDCLMSLGTEYQTIGDHERALEILEEARTLSNQLGNAGDDIRATNLLGQSYLALDKGDKAVECFVKVGEVFKSGVDLKQEFDVMDNLGQAYFKSGDIKKSIHSYQAALDTAKKLNDKLKQGKILQSLGEVHINVKKAQAALSFLNQGLSIVKQSDDKSREIRILQLIGDSNALLNKTEDAINNYEMSMSLCKKVGDQAAPGFILKRIGDIHAGANNYESAIEFYRKGLPIIQKHQMRHLEYNLLSNLGDAHVQMNKFEQAIICFKHSRWLGGKLKEPLLEIKSFWNICKVHEITGDNAQAMYNADKALKICESCPEFEAKKIEKEIQDWVVQRVEKRLGESGS